MLEQADIPARYLGKHRGFDYACTVDSTRSEGIPARRNPYPPALASLRVAVDVVDETRCHGAHGP